MATRWREFAYQVRGKSHALDGRPGQDRFKYQVRHGIRVLCLADGAGSASHSEYGAQTVVSAACNFVIGHLTPGEITVENLDGRSLLAHITAQLRIAAVQLDCELKDLASTFLCVALSDTSFFAAHIGDGVIGAERDGNLEVITWPDNGEFANVTTFVTSADAAGSMQVVHGELEGYSGFVLMSDGTAESLFNYETRSLARACKTLFRIIADAPTYKKDLKRIMDLQIREATDDDCSIGLLARSLSG
jgi:hypothetical protein